MLPLVLLNFQPKQCWLLVVRSLNLSTLACKVLGNLLDRQWKNTFPSFGKNMQENLVWKAPMLPFEAYGKGVEYVADKASMGNKECSRCY